jgi:hypothetical protein
VPKVFEFIKKHKTGTAISLAGVTAVAFASINPNEGARTDNSRMTCRTLDVEQIDGAKYRLKIETSGKYDPDARFIGSVTLKNGAVREFNKDIDDLPIIANGQVDSAVGMILSHGVERVCGPK